MSKVVKWMVRFGDMECSSIFSNYWNVDAIEKLKQTIKKDKREVKEKGEREGDLLKVRRKLH